MASYQSKKKSPKSGLARQVEYQTTILNMLQKQRRKYNQRDHETPHLKSETYFSRSLDFKMRLTESSGQASRLLSCFSGCTP